MEEARKAELAQFSDMDSKMKKQLERFVLVFAIFNLLRGTKELEETKSQLNKERKEVSHLQDKLSAEEAAKLAAESKLQAITKQLEDSQELVANKTEEVTKLEGISSKLESDKQSVYFTRCHLNVPSFTLKLKVLQRTMSHCKLVYKSRNLR